MGVGEKMICPQRGNIAFDEPLRATRSDAGSSRYRYDLEFIREKKRQWRALNRQKCREYMRDYMRKYRKVTAR
jgi:hypothetical protein